MFKKDILLIFGSKFLILFRIYQLKKKRKKDLEKRYIKISKMFFFLFIKKLLCCLFDFY